MVRLTRIYTRTGDDGTTGLFGGQRVRKCDLLVEAYGSVDELNAFLGWAAAGAASASDSKLRGVVRLMKANVKKSSW